MQKGSSSKRVSIVSVTYNSAAVIDKCLASIPKGIKVFVVDNASADETKKVIKENHSKTLLIESKKNVGFGRANNLALEKIKTEFALLLNPDTELQEDSIKKLLATADKYPDAAIIAPTLFHEDGRLQQSYKTSVFQREKCKAVYIKPEGDLCAECLSGAVMLLRMSSFKEIGFFDPNIFLFYEDDDICLKVREAGYSLVITPDSQVKHLMGRSSPATFKNIYLKNWHMMWSRLYLEKKYKSDHLSRMMAIKSLYIYAAKGLLYALRFNLEKAVRSWARSVASIAFLVGKTV